MLFPRSHAWTLKQKWLIAAFVFFGVGAFSMGVYTYERYCRGPGDEIIFGTWLNPITVADEPSYYQFRPDHTFSLWGSLDDKTPIFSGRWYAGGQNIILRVDEPHHSWPMILHIVDISPTEMRVRLSRKSSGDIFTFSRINRDSSPRI